MNFSDTEIAEAVRSRLAQLDKNNDLPVVLMPLDPEIDTQQPRPGVAGKSRIWPKD